jgi:hypothetical protein
MSTTIFTFSGWGTIAQLGGARCPHSITCNDSCASLALGVASDQRESGYVIEAQRVEARELFGFFRAKIAFAVILA